MSVGGPPGGFRSLHRALADPLRLRLLDALWLRSRSVKELARWVELPPDRLYYHLRQLERARLIEVVEYRKLPGGKVERVYGIATAEPPGDDATPEEMAHVLGQVLEATRADINRAFAARAAGATREVSIRRTGLCLSGEHLARLQAGIQALLDAASASPDLDGVWTRVLVAQVDLQDRAAPPVTDGETIDREEL
ncbi:MAG TPA: winged helix-turn-helix domain-containing protein [Thermomicrobiaceae bacterium]|nr:winged helix-turn-helix domain-containing protein [Thermomicrobiaceae bacterium]